MTAPRSFSVKGILRLIIALTGILGFFMTRDIVGSASAWTFAAAFFIALCVEVLEIPRPPRPLMTLGVLLLLAVILSQVRRRNFVEPFFEALLAMTVVRVLEEKSAREYAQIALLCLACLVATALLTVEKFFVVACSGFAVLSSLILTLSAWLEREPDARVTLRGALGLLGRALGIFFLALPLTLFLFFSAPRAATPLLRGRIGPNTAAFTGFTGEMRLGDVSEIQTSDRVAFRAEVPSAPRELYWRGVVLSFFTGDSWNVNLAARQSESLSFPSNEPQVKQTITLEPGEHRWLFALDRPITVLGVERTATGDGTFLNQGRTRGRLQYQALSISTAHVPSQGLRRRELFLQLPEYFSPQLRALAQHVTEGLADEEKPAALMRRFAEEGFEWSLKDLPTGKDSLETFTFVTKKGNCEYFASALAVLLRAAGVPARLVGGFRGGLYNRTGEYYVVTDRMAHIWVEAWDDETSAWRRFDPTPTGVVDEMGAAGSIPTSAWAEYWDFLDYQWSKLFVGYDAEVRSQLVQRLQNLLRNPRASLSPNLDGATKLGTAFLTPVIFSGALLCLFTLAGLAWRRARRDPRERLLERFVRIMARRGYRRRKSEGLEEFLDSVEEPLRSAALPFVRRFQDVRYGGAALDEATRRELTLRLDALDALRKLRQTDVGEFPAEKR